MNPVEPAKRSKDIKYEVSGPSRGQPVVSFSEGLPLTDDGSLE
jgi:hypothetical protein